MKFKYLIILISIGLLCILYFLSLFSHPSLISLSTVQEHMGQQVIVQGVVTDYRLTTYGTQLITIREQQNSTSSVMIYLEGELLVEYGDIIQAIGEVQQYKNQWEVVVNDPQLIIILKKWHTQSFPLWQIAQHPEYYLDTTVNITGIITQTGLSSFLLTSTDGTSSIDVFYPTSRPHDFSDGDIVAIGAQFLYDSTVCRYFLKVTENTHGIWKIQR